MINEIVPEVKKMMNKEKQCHLKALVSITQAIVCPLEIHCDGLNLALGRRLSALASPVS